MKKFLAGYVTGVITAPVVVYVFRKPIFKALGPTIGTVVAKEEWDEKLYEFMSARNDFQDFKRKYEKSANQMKAQGYSVSEIADIIGCTERAVKALLKDNG